MKNSKSPLNRTNDTRKSANIPAMVKPILKNKVETDNKQLMNNDKTLHRNTNSNIIDVNNLNTNSTFSKVDTKH